MGRRQALGDFPADAQHFGHGQPSLAAQPVFQGLSLEQGHGHEWYAAVLANLVDGDHVIVLDGGGRLGFPQEALAGGEAGTTSRQQHFQSHRATQLDVLRSKNDAHAPGTQNAQDAVGPQPAHLSGPLRGPQRRVNLRGKRFLQQAHGPLLVGGSRLPP